MLHLCFAPFRNKMRTLTLLTLLSTLLSIAAAAPQSPQTPAATSTLFTTSCPAASWPPKNIGTPIVAQIPDQELQSIMSQIDPRRIENIINKLVSFGTRHTLSSQTDPRRGIGAARDWIADEMRSFAKPSNGRMTVEVKTYLQQAEGRILFPVNISNIIATLHGSDPTSNRFYVISGHYDSRITDINNYKDDSPGADDEYDTSLLKAGLLRLDREARSLTNIKL